jgi:hypothetical protein
MPQHYSHEVNGELLYKFCAALTRNGFGSPATWEQCRNPVAFAQSSIMNAIGAERVDLLRRNVEWRLEISDTLSDGYFTGDDDPQSEKENSASAQAAPAQDTSGSAQLWMLSNRRRPVWAQPSIDRWCGRSVGSCASMTTTMR